MTTPTLTPNQLVLDQPRLEAVNQYLPVVAAAFARTARTAARAAATPFALVCMVDGTHLHFKAGFGLEIRQTKQSLPDNMALFLPLTAVQTNHPVHLEILNRLFSSKSGWQKHFFAFQASVPLRGADGQILGALIVMDEQIRELDIHGLTMLEDIAEGLITELDLRRQLEHAQTVQILTPEAILEPVTEPEIIIAPENWYDPAKISESSAAAIIGQSLAGEIMYANKAAAQLLGYSHENLIGANTSTILPDSLTDLSSDLLEQLHSGQALLPVATKRRHRSGKELDVRIAFAPIFNQNKEVIGISSTILLNTEKAVVPVVVPQIPAFPVTVFSVNIEGQITACTGTALPLFENPQAMIGQLIFKAFQLSEALLEAVCFALLGEEHESTITLGNQSVRLHLHPVHRTGQPSDVIGIAIPVA